MSQPVLWRHFVLKRPPSSSCTQQQQGQWFAAARNILTHCGVHVRAASIKCGTLAWDGMHSMLALMSLLSPQLAKLSIDIRVLPMHIYRPAPTRSPIISAALHAFPRLTHPLCCNELLPPDAAPLQALTALRSLDICCHFGLATSVAAAAVSLTSLTALSLARVTSTADNLPPAGLHTSLTRLTQLHALTILYNVAPPDEAAAGDEPVLNAGGVPMLVLPSFSELPALERLEVSYQAGIQVCHEHAPPFAVTPASLCCMNRPAAKPNAGC